jgi:3-oxoacyl-[acyl-carrier protein] reductase
MISKPIALRGRNAIVTGGARGIGSATAVALAREGANVVISDIIPGDETVSMIHEMGCKALFLKTDVTNLQDVTQMIDKAVHAFGRIDILVNNAGIMHRDGLLETSESTFHRVINVNLKGTFFCMQAVYPHMRDNGYGKIVNVSSISGIIGGAVSKSSDTPDKMTGRSGPIYAASKGGILALTRWIAKDVAKDGIYVNAIAPGACETDMTAGYNYSVDGLPIPRMGHPKDMAEAILFLASDASSYITGQVINVDGGWVMG